MDKKISLSKYPAFSYPDFRLFFLGNFFSNIGNQMQIVALNWQIYLLTHSALSLGLIGLSRFIPIVCFSLIGGAFADTHNRKRIMYVTQVAMAFTAAVLAVATMSHSITPFLIYSMTIVASIAMSFDGPVRQALIPSLVEKKHLPNAMSLNMIMWQTATIVGPGIAGFAIGRLGVGSIYVFNAISFFALIYALFRMQTTGAIQGEPSGISWKAVREGLSFVRHTTLIWSTMILDFFSTFFASATTLLPIFARDILRVGPEGLGFLYAAPAVGAVITGLFMAHRSTIKRQGRTLLTAVGIFGIATIIFGLSKNFYLSLIALAFVGVGDSISTIIRNTVRQLMTPDYIRGRMTSVNMIFFMGGPQLGEFEGGVLAAAVGGPISVIIGGIGVLVAVSIVVWRIPTLREYKGAN